MCCVWGWCVKFWIGYVGWMWCVWCCDDVKVIVNVWKDVCVLICVIEKCWWVCCVCVEDYFVYGICGGCVCDGVSWGFGLFFGNVLDCEWLLLELRDDVGIRVDGVCGDIFYV